MQKILQNQEPIVILLVEDEEAHAEIVRRNLASFPVAHRVVHVQDGQLALDYLFRKNTFAEPSLSPTPQLVLLDLHLPKVEGLEVLRQIKQDEELKKIPTIILTTSSADADIAAVRALGGDSYQLKPLLFEGFTDMFTEGDASGPLFPHW